MKLETVQSAFRVLGAVLPLPAECRPVDRHDEPRAIAETVRLAEIWRVALHDVADSDLELAVLHWLKTGKFWPKPAEIRESLPAARAVPGEVAVGSAMWTRLLRLAAVRGGNAGPPAMYLDPEGPEKHLEGAIRAGVEAVGGWRALCAATPDDWLRRRFVEAFDAEVRRDRTDRDLGEMRALADMGPGGLRLLPGGKAAAR